MDKPIQKPKWSARAIGLIVGIGVVSMGLIAMVAARTRETRQSIDSGVLTVAQVTRTSFQEYVPVNGTVQPNTTVYLDLEEGGIVEKIYVQGGSSVQQGELILSFTNSTAQKQNIEAETRLLENLDQLRNSKLDLVQSRLTLQDQLLDLDFKIDGVEQTFERYERLVKTPSAQISREQFEATRRELTYLRSKRILLQERIRREAELQQQQSQQIETSIERVNRNLELLGRIIDDLHVRAPLTGRLSSLNVQVGQSFQRGARIGQVDQLGSFKVYADIDQFYISKVAVAQRGAFEFANKSYVLEVSKIFPEVQDGVFHADLNFVEGYPPNVKRGQTVHVDLSLSDPRVGLVVPKGSFYRHTLGRWIYKVEPGGRTARRTRIVTGRQNPQSVEVLEGLQVGDWVITSNYAGFGDVDELTFEKSALPP